MLFTIVTRQLEAFASAFLPNVLLILGFLIQESSAFEFKKGFVVFLLTRFSENFLGPAKVAFKKFLGSDEKIPRFDKTCVYVRSCFQLWNSLRTVIGSPD